jgi:phosphoribosylpyrophosphate synthetase
VVVPEAVRGRRILLVDDIISTGATVATCTKALRVAGAADVIAAAVARPYSRLDAELGSQEIDDSPSIAVLAR